MFVNSPGHSQAASLETQGARLLPKKQWSHKAPNPCPGGTRDGYGGGPSCSTQKLLSSQCPHPLRGALAANMGSFPQPLLLAKWELLDTGVARSVLPWQPVTEDGPARRSYSFLLDTERVHLWWPSSSRAPPGVILSSFPCPVLPPSLLFFRRRLSHTPKSPF